MCQYQSTQWPIGHMVSNLNMSFSNMHKLLITWAFLSKIFPWPEDFVENNSNTESMNSIMALPEPILTYFFACYMAGQVASELCMGPDIHHRPSGTAWYQTKYHQKVYWYMQSNGSAKTKEHCSPVNMLSGQFSSNTHYTHCFVHS